MKWLFLCLGMMGLLLASGASAYEHDYYTNMTSASSDFRYSLNSSIAAPSGSCYSDIDYYITLVNPTGNAYSTQFSLYLDGVLNHTVSLAGTDNKSCYLLATRRVGNFSNSTARAQTFSPSALNITIMMEVHTVCNSSDTYVLYDSGFLDSGIAGANGYRILQFYPSGNVTIPNNASIGHCGGAESAYGGWSIFSSLIRAIVVKYMWDFNSGLGDAFINITNPGDHGLGDSYNCYLLNMVTQSQSAITPSAFLGLNLSLQPLTDYRLVCEWYNNYITTPISHDFPPSPFYLNITDVSPDYVCSFTPCSNGSRQYLCIDSKGYYPDTQVDISCLGANQTIDLGFEMSRPVVEQNCRLEFLQLPPCSVPVVENISAGLPDSPEWTVFPFNISGSGLNEYFATMVSGGSKGSFSFRMWSIPPSPPVQPTLVNTTIIECGNVSVGSIPDTFIPGLNATFFTARNFTFPSDTMHILFDAKRCSAPVVQYDGWCGKSCFSYLGNCSIAPLGDYFVSVVDNTLGQTVVLYTSEATTNWSSRDMDVSNHITYPDHSYTLVMGIGDYPQDAYSPYSWCVQFDDVRLFNAVNGTKDESALQRYGKVYDDLTDEQKAVIDGSYCQSNVCSGNNRLISSLQSGVCVTETVYNDSTCVQINPANKVIGSQSIFAPISSISGMVTNSTTGETLADSWKVSGFGFMLILITPIFLIMMFISIMMILAAWVTKHMEIGIGAGLMILGAFCLAIPELVLITIILIVITAFLVGRTMIKVVAGGGS